MFKICSCTHLCSDNNLMEFAANNGSHWNILFQNIYEWLGVKCYIKFGVFNCLWLNLFPLDVEVRCGQVINFWRNSSSDIDTELYKGNQRSKSKGQITDIVSGTFLSLCFNIYIHNVWKIILIFILLFWHLVVFNFLNSNEDGFNVTVWYNSTHQVGSLRIPRSVNLV